jgi:hypothetical protein
MAHFEQQVPIIRDGWDRIEFRLPSLSAILWTPEQGSLYLPDGRMLHELICVPHPHTVLSLLSIHKLPDETKRRIIEIVTRKYPIPSWLEIKEVLEEDDIHKSPQFGRLYAVVDRNCHTPLQKFNYHSQKLLQSYSNRIVNTLIYRRDNPPETEIRIQDFCEKNGIPYEEYQLHDLTIRYFCSMLPHPIRTVPNKRVERDFVTRAGINSLGELERLNTHLRESPKERKHIHHLVNEDARSYELFFAFRDSWQYKNKLEDYLDSIGLASEFKSLSSPPNKLDRTFAQVEKLSRGKTREELPQLLCQCQFCFNFRLEKPANGKISRYCGDKDSVCAKAERAWRDRLRDKGITLGKLSL